MHKIPKDRKYQLDYEPDEAIPRGVMAYMKMVVKRHPKLWAYLLITDVIHALRYPVSFYLVGLIIDTLMAHQGEGVPQEAWYYAAMIFGALFIGEMCHLIPHYASFNWVEYARPQLRSDMLAYTLRHSFTYYQNHFAGGLARKISEGIEKIPNLSTQIRWEILLPIINMSASCLILFKVSWLYASSICILLFAILLPVLVKLKKLQVKTQRFADVRSKVTGQIVDTISNIAVVKSFANEAHEMDEHRAVSEEEMAAWHKMLRVFLLLDNYRRLVLVCFGGGMAVACVIGWQHGVITIGEIATIMGITFNFTGLVWSMSFGIVHAAESLGYLNDSLDTITRPHHITDKPDAQDLQVTKGEIAYRDVTFEYASNPVFEGLSLTIAPQERIGLIGPSGAGKTTLVNLLQRFFDVQHGTIRIDGQNIADMTQHSLRKALSFIPQDTTLFHRSLKDNIRYGKLDASDEEVIAAAKTAHAHEFITELPEGYDTLVGERGVKLSGGQRQRIAIARAILKNAPILILDEATSALDSESEQRIQEGLQTLMQGRTVIAIAHRLSTINHLDRLVVMDQGQIVEEGSHKQLLRKKGLYARLWDMQSGGFLPE